MANIFTHAQRILNMLARRRSLIHCVKQQSRVSYPPRRYYKGTLTVRITPECERGMQRALDRVFPEDGPLEEEASHGL